MKATDPVCGMAFQVDKAVTQTEYEGKMYHFCTEACRRQFEKEPERYVGRASSP